MNEQNTPAEKWIILRSRYVPAVWPVLTYWNWDVKGFLGVKTTGDVLSVWKKGDYTAVLERAPFLEMETAMEQLMLRRADKLTELRAEGIEAGTKLVSTCKAFAEKASQVPIVEFSNFLLQLNDSYVALMRTNMHWWLLASGPIERRVKKALSHLAQDEIAEIMHTMSHSATPSYSKREEAEFENLVEYARENGLTDPEVIDLIGAFSNKYFWFPYEYVGPAIWNVEAVTSRVEEALQRPAQAAPSHDIAETQKNCITKYGLSEEVQKLFLIMQTMGLMQDDRKMFNAQVCYYVNHIILSELARKLEITLDEARYVDQQLISLVEINRAAFADELKKRLEITVTVTRDSKTQLYSGEQAELHLKQNAIKIGHDGSEVKEIKGQVANKGTAQGKVRVLRSSHAPDFTDGEIIVTGMTTPDFAPLMKKAAAIITDEGGITCHAAIVSRELNKPCIIGTKHATQILKDGNLVEVDAVKGIITIIS